MQPSLSNGTMAIKERFLTQMYQKTILAVALGTAITLQAASAQSFHHPGAFDSLSEFQERQEGLRHGIQPWTDDFAKLRSRAC